MPFRISDCTTCIALTLAMAAAIMSAPGRADETYQKLRWLLLTSTTPEAAVIAGAIGEQPDSLLSP